MQLLDFYSVALYMLAAAWGLVTAAAIRSGRGGLGFLAALGYTPILSSYYGSVYQAVYGAVAIAFHIAMFALIAAHTVQVAALLYMAGGGAGWVVDAYLSARSVVESTAPLAAGTAAALLALRAYAALARGLRPRICPVLLEASVVLAYLAAYATPRVLHLVVVGVALALLAPAMGHVSRVSRLASKALLRRTRGIPGAHG